MTSMLQTVVTSGTAAAIPGMGFNRPAAGKTGTTNDYSDAWFVGFTPQVTCGVWVGVDERRGMGYGVTGAKGAIPIWVPVMIALHRELPVKSFFPPDGVVALHVCETSHKLASSFCPEYYTEYFIGGSLPDSCSVHGPGQAAKSGSMLRRFGTSAPAIPPEEKTRSRKLIF
jgi:penicillin-binding protein 1A